MHPLLDGFELHQNLAMAITIFFFKYPMNHKDGHNIGQKGYAMDFIRISFTPLDNHYADHPLTLCCNLSIKNAKILHLDPLISSIIPK